jgi:sugar phosphate permease
MRADQQSAGRGAPAFATIAALAVGYVGVYLCRKNLAVAMPLLRDAFGASRAEVGMISTISTAAYALGKATLGPLVDRVGGRRGFIAVLLAVAIFGGAGAAMPSLTLLTLTYSANRFAGAGGWGAMMKLVPTWFDSGRGKVIAALSLSYVLGGGAATLLASRIVAHGGGWRAVMGAPSLVLLPIALVCALVVRPGPLTPQGGAATAASRGTWKQLLARPQFLVVCALSFSLTLMRESFNTWSVDFLASVQPAGARSLSAAGLQSTAFDLAGGLSILIMGAAYDRTPQPLRRWLIAGILALLAVLLAVAPAAAMRVPTSGAWLLAAVGLLVHGPYSLLAGVFALEYGGVAAAATAASIIDAVGYLASILAGAALGRLLDIGGYTLGFGCLAAITAASAVIALMLKPASNAAGLDS